MTEMDSVGVDPRAKGDRSQAACLRRPVPHGVRTPAAWSSPGPSAASTLGDGSGSLDAGFRRSFRQEWNSVVHVGV